MRKTYIDWYGVEPIDNLSYDITNRSINITGELGDNYRKICDLRPMDFDSEYLIRDMGNLESYPNFSIRAVFGMYDLNKNEVELYNNVIIDSADFPVSFRTPGNPFNPSIVYSNGTFGRYEFYIKDSMDNHGYVNNNFYLDLILNNPDSGIVYVKQDSLNDIANSIRKRLNCENLPIRAAAIPYYTDIVGYGELSLGQFRGGGVFIPKAIPQTDMSSAYSGNQTDWMYPVCGFNVINMYGAFRNCVNLKASGLCGPYVVNMSYAYWNCTNMFGDAMIGKNVKDTSYAFWNCGRISNLFGDFENVINMAYAFYGCRSMSGKPLMGNNVVNMQNAYNGCLVLKGSPLCGNNVIDMSNAYRNCQGLTGKPASGPNVYNMAWTYLSCHNIKGEPVFGPNVEDITGTYKACVNLTGKPILPEKATNMVETYAVSNITGNPVCSDNIKSMVNTYYSCSKLNGQPISGRNVTNMYGTYMHSGVTGCAVFGENVHCIINAYAWSNIESALFDSSATGDMKGVFAGCINIRYIYVNKDIKYSGSEGWLGNNSNMWNLAYKYDPSRSINIICGRYCSMADCINKFKYPFGSVISFVEEPSIAGFTIPLADPYTGERFNAGIFINTEVPTYVNTLYNIRIMKES